MKSNVVVRVRNRTRSEAVFQEAISVSSELSLLSWMASATVDSVWRQDIRRRGEQ